MTPIILMLEDDDKRLARFWAVAMIGELELAGWTYHRVPPFGDDWIEADWFRVVKRALKARR